MAPKLLDLKQGNPASRIYAGALDPANGYAPGTSVENALKFHALFYEHIIVPDSFLHSLGPVTESIRRCHEQGEPYANHAVLRLLKEGVVVPALRRGNSLVENFERHVGGITPGEHLHIKPKDKEILDTIESQMTTIAHWPKKMARAMDPEYTATLHSLFIDSAGRPAIFSHENVRKLNRLKQEDDYRWRPLLDDFCASLDEQKRQRFSRRGLLEEVIVKHLQIPFTEIYNVLHPTGTTLRTMDPRIVIAAYLMDVTATVYEGYQADQFRAVGGLLNHYNRAVIDADFYAHLGRVAGCMAPLQWPVVCEKLFDTSKISLEKVIEFRGSGDFEQYVRLVAAWKAPQGEESIKDANPKLYAYLLNNYAKAIIAKFPDAITPDKVKGIASWVTYAAMPLLPFAVRGLGHLVTGELTTTVETISMFGVPIITSIGKIAEKTAASVSRLATNSRNRRDLAQFRQTLNNFLIRRPS